MINKHCDVVIIGGGVAALWIFALLQEQGFSVLLVEKNELGCGQTGFSQGILHAGVKYSLSGEVTQAAKATHEAVELWQQAFKGQGIVDLSAFRSSHSHCLVIKGGFQAQFKAMLTTQLVSSHCQKLTKQQYPAFFQNPAFKGAVCQLDEIVLDVPLVVQAFADRFSDHFLQADSIQLVKNTEGKVESIDLQSQGQQLCIKPQWTILAAGEGNESLLQGLVNPPLMQRRPLHMVAVKHPALKPIWAHILEKGTTPSLTITTHNPDDPFWYVGGEIAESRGVLRNEEQQMSAARTELERCFPWVNLDQAEWRFVRINRAEGKMPGGKRPDHSVVVPDQNYIVCWPTKLVLAPVMARTILEHLIQGGCARQHHDLEWAKHWIKPKISEGIRGVFAS